MMELKIIQGTEWAMEDGDRVFVIRTELPPQGVASTDEIAQTFRGELAEVLREVGNSIRGAVVKMMGRNILTNSALAAVCFLLNGARAVKQEQFGGTIITVVDNSIYVDGLIPLQPGIKLVCDLDVFGKRVEGAEVEVVAVSRNRRGKLSYNLRGEGGDTHWVREHQISVREVK
jgi:hypothetical protein